MRTPLKDQKDYVDCVCCPTLSSDLSVTSDAFVSQLGAHGAAGICEYRMLHGSKTPTIVVAFKPFCFPHGVSRERWGEVGSSGRLLLGHHAFQSR